MPNYTPITDFEVKDGLAHGEPEKIVSGGEIQAELDAIAAAIASKVGSTFNMISALQTEEVAQLLSDLMFEVGMVMPWYGSTLDIPTGWALCNGTNGTPDLRNKFVVGAGSLYNLNAAGGAVSGTTSSSGSGPTSDHTLTEDEVPLPAHAHFMFVDADVVESGALDLDAVTGVARRSNGGGDTSYRTQKSAGDPTLGVSGITGTGSADPHSHTIPDHTHTVDTLPPYYGLYYIMYTGFDTDAGIGNVDTPLAAGALNDLADVTLTSVAVADKLVYTGTEWVNRPDPFVIQLSCSDLTTALTADTAVAYARAPRAFTLTGVRASLLTTSSSGVVTIDVNVGGVTVLSTKLTIDANEKTSVTAATPAVISGSSVTDDAEITIDIDAEGTDAAGLIVTLLGY